MVRTGRRSQSGRPPRTRVGRCCASSRVGFVPRRRATECCALLRRVAPRCAFDLPAQFRVEQRVTLPPGDGVRVHPQFPRDLGHPAPRQEQPGRHDLPRLQAGPRWVRSAECAVLLRRVAPRCAAGRDGGRKGRWAWIRRTRRAGWKRRLDVRHLPQCRPRRRQNRRCPARPARPKWSRRHANPLPSKTANGPGSKQPATVPNIDRTCNEKFDRCETRDRMWAGGMIVPRLACQPCSRPPENTAGQASRRTSKGSIDSHAIAFATRPGQSHVRT